MGEKIREVGVRREEETREKRKISFTRALKFFKDQVQGSFISHYLHQINIERKVQLQHMTSNN